MAPTNSKKRASKASPGLLESSKKLKISKEKPELTWGTEEEPSLFSDWKIIVTSTTEPPKEDDGARSISTTAAATTTTTTTTTYTVHKAMVGLGPRSSGYFLRLFQNDTQFVESKDSTSRIELKPSEAAVVPIMLDYIYEQNPQIKMPPSEFVDMLDKREKAPTPGNVLALKHLADYFEIPTLLACVDCYILDDITRFAIDDLDELEEYITGANVYNDEFVYDVVDDAVRDNWEEFFLSEDRRSTIYPKFMELLPMDVQRSILLRSLLDSVEHPPGSRYQRR